MDKNTKFYLLIISLLALIGCSSASTENTESVTITGQVILGFGSHDPVAELPLWIGLESKGEPVTKTNEDGTFILTDLPVDQTIYVVDSHLDFEVPPTSGGEVDLGLLKYPLIHPPASYWKTPEPISDLSTIIIEGYAVDYRICQADKTWQHPSRAVQQREVWEKRPFREKGEQFLTHWFEQPAEIYDTADIFVQSFPGSLQLDELGSDWHYLLGLWTKTDFSLGGSGCEYGRQELEDLLARREIEVWLLEYQAEKVWRWQDHFLVAVKPESGYQIIRFPGNEGPLTVHIVAGREEIIQLPNYCGSAENSGCEK